MSEVLNHALKRVIVTRNVANYVDPPRPVRGKKAKKGIFVTASKFTKEAIDYANQLEDPIILIDGDRLRELMIDHNVGVSNTKSYEIKTIDSDYFTED